MKRVRLTTGMTKALLALLSFSGSLSPIAFGAGQTYRHEVLTGVEYLTSSGTTEAGKEGSKTEVKQGTLNVTLGYGYLLSDLVEPTVEIKYASASHQVASFESLDSKSEFALGVLFNVPIPTEATKGLRPGEIQAKSWVPFAGILLSKIGAEQTRSGDSKSTLAADEMVTKLIVGSRYMVFNNIALHSSLRLFYQTNKTTQTGSDGATAAGSTSNKLTVEFRLLSFSLLF